MITTQAAISFVCSYLCCSLFWLLSGFKKRTKQQNLLLVAVYLYFLAAIGIVFGLRWLLFEYFVLPSFFESPFLFLSGVVITYPFYREFESRFTDSEDSNDDTD